ncbi:uncharacterized protein LOC115956557 [Quercus lobata]|uniref:uncharacterized protein LOC115956557 n=1 Tax=Quercus lobata TaxID=97700 RepID=UPI00124675A4|nr:uncharacterized protein LOC115956557 [Quercus lobata]
MNFHPILSFSEEDKKGTTRPHDDALLITLKIRDYDVNRMMMDGGSGTEVMYPDLYEGLRLKPEDLMPYNSPLMSLDGKFIIPKDTIRLPIQTGLEIVEVNFIVVDAYSPYTAIVGRPWLHTLGAVASSLHQKVKFPSGDQVLKIRGCQSTARQAPVSPPDTAAEEVKCEDLEKVVIGGDPEKFFQDACDAPGFDPAFICHHLNANPSITSKNQPPRHPSREHANAIRDEVVKLKHVGAIKEVFYTEWLANTVVVKKKSGKLWEKTAFVTPTRNYHYKVMSFGLKNTGPTYQRMMTRIFKSQLGKSIEIYVDDMVVKSKVVSEHLGDLDSTFDVLRKHNPRLNASKCSFGVGSGKFLGYMVTYRGIEVNSDQSKAINDLKLPQNTKEVQKLTRMITALNRFISKSANRYRPFYLLINKWKGFEWSEDCIVTFQQLKEYLSWPPIISSPEADEVLYAYIVVAPYAVSLVLIRDDNSLQKPVYYVSKSLHEAEVRYLPLEKAILTVVCATRKLPHYFQTHTVVILTQLPLKSVLRTADYTGRIAIWSIILGAFDIKYMPRTSIKSQVLADLVVEFAEPPVEIVAKERNMDGKSVGVVSMPGPLCWKVYIDSTTNQRGSGVGLVLVSPEKTIIEKSLKLGFSTTNNEAEYEALLQGMAMVQKMRGKAVEMFSDSRLVVGQSDFDLFSLSHVFRSGNTHANSLATLATAKGLPRIILVEHLDRANEVAKGMVHIHEVRMGPSWMDPIMRFLKDDILPEEKSEAEKIRRNASWFRLSKDHKLYKRSYSRPYLLCIYPEASELLLEELHEGICESHTRGRPLSHRAITQEYWWSEMQKEALEYVKKCDQCQRFAPNIHQPGGVLNPLSNPWSFA